MADPYRRFVSLDYLAACGLLSAAAGAIHGRVVLDHFNEGVLIAGFFVGAAVLQVWWALLVMRRPTRRLLVAGVALSMLLIGTWIVSRTVGVPVGPDAGDPEVVGTVDVLASLYELGIIAAVVRAWRGPLPRSIDLEVVHPSFYFLVAPVAVITLYALLIGH